MADPLRNPPRVWSVAEAKARLSEVLRLAQEEGPQRIGRRRTFVVVPAAEWEARASPRPPLGRWLVDNLPRGANLDPRGGRGSARAIPFAAGDAE
ncbi:MAG: type II toxin-antitoxin system prevent-host-death family antitoxin [Defluviicoccus sp.]|nr:type II toxin-antitoxin system prevent-host-death family antitoxin [Defluviicoccus sp.]MDE0386135.1 type II toxin-antitoxin system prevent-host-death family antitoxin [Defluviicoccus sp.]